MICFELYIYGRCVKKRSCTRRLFGRRSTEAVIFHTFNRVTRAAFIISPSALSTAAPFSSDAHRDKKIDTAGEESNIVGQGGTEDATSSSRLTGRGSTLVEEPALGKVCVWPTPAAIKSRLHLPTWMLGMLEGVAVLQKTTDGFQITGSTTADMLSRCETHCFFVTLRNPPSPLLTR